MRTPASSITPRLRNAARRGGWAGTAITFYAQHAQLKDIRAADPERYGRWAFTCERAAIRRLDRAFQAFYRRCQAGRSRGYPRSRGAAGGTPLSGRGTRTAASWDSVPHPTVTRVYLQGIGHVRVHQHRAVKGTVKTITVKREGNRWYVVLSCDDVPAEPLQPTGAVVGIDMGIASFPDHQRRQARPEPAPAGCVCRPARRRPAVPCPQEARQQPATQGRAQESPHCTARSAAPASTMPTRPLSRWCAITT